MFPDEKGRKESFQSVTITGGLTVLIRQDLLSRIGALIDTENDSDKEKLSSFIYDALKLFINGMQSAFGKAAGKNPKLAESPEEILKAMYKFTKNKKHNNKMFVNDALEDYLDIKDKEKRI